MTVRDPYVTLGVRASASDEEIRTAYRRLVQLHHPDHNAGSPESARRFEEVQEAYARIRQLRATAPPREPGPRPASDPALDARLQDLERQVRKAQDKARKAQEKASRAAGNARQGADTAGEKARQGYVSTDDSFSKIAADARDELAARFSHAREHPVVRRVSALIEGLDDLASKLDEDRRPERRRDRR